MLSIIDNISFFAYNLSFGLEVKNKRGCRINGK